MGERIVAGFNLNAPRRRARSPVCRCVHEFNANMAELDLNTDICCDLFTGAVAIAAEKLDPARRKKPITIIASYCPFCGKKYVEVETKAAGVGEQLHA